MALYEHTFLARQDVSGQQAEALVEHFKKVLEENGGKVGRVENWGLRTAAYRINKNRKGHYAHLGVEAPAAALMEVERKLKIHDDVLRYLTVRVDEISTEQSPILAKREERKRRDHDDRGRGRPPREAAKTSS